MSFTNHVGTGSSWQVLHDDEPISFSTSSVVTGVYLSRVHVICWKEMASYIENEKWREEQSSDSEHIIVTAAKLLRATIREASYDTDYYPNCSTIEDTLKTQNWMPNLLQLFLNHLIYPEEKKTSLGHCIVQAVRPRTAIAPIPFAVGVSIDNICASKYLLNLLHKLGLSCSYDKVCRYKQCVARCESTETDQPVQQGFTQYALQPITLITTFAHLMAQELCMPWVLFQSLTLLTVQQALTLLSRQWPG